MSATSRAPFAFTVIPPIAVAPTPVDSEYVKLVAVGTGDEAIVNVPFIEHAATDPLQLAPAMTAFGLSTEPWLFLLDRNGVVVYRVEGLFTVDEIDHYIPDVLDS